METGSIRTAGFPGSYYAPVRAWHPGPAELLQLHHLDGRFGQDLVELVAPGALGLGVRGLDLLGRAGADRANAATRRSRALKNMINIMIVID